MIRPANPPTPTAVPSAVEPALSPVCTPSIPVTALNGCVAPLPDTKPARRRSSHHRQDSGVAATATDGQALEYVPASTPLPLPAMAAGAVVQRVAALGSSPGMAR